MSKKKDPKNPAAKGARSKSDQSQEHAASLAKLAEPSKQGGKRRAGARLRNYLLTGLIVVGPVGITLYVVWWFINLIDAWVKPLVPAIYNPDTYLPFSIPGIGLLFAIFGLMIIGALTANLFGRTLLSYGEMIVGRMPVVRNVYSALKQIFETVLSQSNNSFQQVGLIEYPRPGLYAIVFVSKETGGEISKQMHDDALLSVFLPTTPNPTSGYLLFVPKEEVIILDMTVEEAAKLVISAGLVEPDVQAKLHKIAEERRPRRRRKATPAKEPEKLPEAETG